jgi:restriction system protein
VIGATGSAYDGDREYVLLRQAEAEKRNTRLAEAVGELETILSVGLARDARVALGEVRGEPTPADLPIELRAATAPDRARFDPPPLGFLAALRPGAAARRALAVEGARSEFQAALARWERRKTRQDEAMARLRAEARDHNRQIDALHAALEAGEPEAVERQAELVLLASPYPEGFHKELKTQLVSGSSELVVDLRAPTLADVVPRVERFKFLKPEDHIVALRKPEPDRQALYERIVSQMALRTFHELFSTDVGRHIEAIKLSLYRTMVDPGTGKTVRSSILSTRVSRQQLENIDLAHVDPVICLRRLAGPDGFQPEPPIEGW